MSKKNPMKLFTRINRNILLILSLVGFAISTQGQAKLILTINELKNWAPTASNSDNISTTPISTRTVVDNHQISNNLNKDFKILYAPDGMNNWAPYTDSSNQFNHFNFSHWQYTDIIAWFGGSAGETVLIPSKSWIDAAHKNGVKVIGCVFFAPIAWGGSPTSVSDFLQRDLNNNFIAATKLKEIADYYNFDGWLLNFETDVSSTIAAEAKLFVQELNNATNKELIWYDAMLPTGPVSWQNELNNNNSYFFENSTGMFTNYWWGFSQVTNSVNKANSLGRSPYDVYMGADMWPGRNNQPAFSSYNWINIIVPGGNARTSIAVFATNFTFNYPPFSDFQNNVADYDRFYSTERKIFSGLDEDPFTTDPTWKGLANYVPVRSTILSLPFTTEFNTGHGRDYYEQGTIITNGDWHNMTLQSPLPSWSFKSDNLTSIDYAFDDAFTGGSCLSISSGTGGNYNIPLYSTALTTSTNGLEAEISYKLANSGAVQYISLEFLLDNGNTVEAGVAPTTSSSWTTQMSNTQMIPTGAKITAINLKIVSNGNFDLKLGKIAVDEGAPTNNQIVEDKPDYITVFHNPTSGYIEVLTTELEQTNIRIFNLNGQQIRSQSTFEGTMQLELPFGVYFYEITGTHMSEGSVRSSGKVIVK